MHRIQDMHMSKFVSLGSLIEIAPVGHFLAQSPQDLQVFATLGFKGTPLYSLYGTFPGTFTISEIELKM